MYISRRHIKLPNTSLIHVAAVALDGDKITYTTFCGKKGTYHTRFQKKSSEPITCKVCLRVESGGKRNERRERVGEGNIG